jgi:hypothetical protein
MFRVTPEPEVTALDVFKGTSSTFPLARTQLCRVLPLTTPSAQIS